MMPRIGEQVRRATFGDGIVTGVADAGRRVLVAWQDDDVEGGWLNAADVEFVDRRATPAAPDVGHASTHQLAWDPPAAITAALRWTCTVCGHAVLDYAGTVYGSAVDSPCSPSHVVLQ